MRENIWFMCRKVIVIFAVFVGIFLSACVDINLKSELPEVDYYELDNIKADEMHCEAYSLIALENIDIPQSLAGKNIIYKDDSRISTIKGINLNDSLKSSVESMLIKNFSNSCIKIITSPFSGIKLEQYLRIKFLDFHIVKDVDSTRAIVSFLYQMYQNGEILQSNIITKASHLDSLEAKVAFKALQDSTNEAIKELNNKITAK